MDMRVGLLEDAALNEHRVTESLAQRVQELEEEVRQLLARGQ
jgi:actin-like ATPase involved in cell morphogenesis